MNIEAILEFCREAGLTDRQLSELSALLLGARDAQRRESIEKVEAADQEPMKQKELASNAAALRQRARAILGRLLPQEEEKQEAWILEGTARDLESQAHQASARRVRLLWEALLADRGNDTAAVALARHYRALHEEAETRGMRETAARCESLLRLHDRGENSQYLRGCGAVSVATDVPATVEVLRFDPDRQSWVDTPVEEKRTPWVEVELPMGSYLLILRAPGRIPVRYPVRIRRGEHWHGVRPGEMKAQTIHLPGRDDWHPDNIYVPAGWFWAGGEIDALGPQRLWTDGFIIRKFPVTNAEYQEFLESLPPETAETFGRFHEAGDHRSTHWHPKHPVTQVSWAAAMAFSEWWSGRVGTTWRLPAELEWEKAARGVDGRIHPWGDRYDVRWARTRETIDGQRHPSPVDSFENDRSVYGVRGISGNVAEWCLNEPENLCIRSDGLVAVAVRAGRVANRSVRGGRYDGQPVPLATRMMATPSVCDRGIGFRLIRPL